MRGRQPALRITPGADPTQARRPLSSPRAPTALSRGTVEGESILADLVQVCRDVPFPRVCTNESNTIVYCVVPPLTVGTYQVFLDDEAIGTVAVSRTDTIPCTEWR